MKKAERKEQVERYVEMVHLTSAIRKRPAELSGGMQQRVGIARAFALQPKMLLLDEPFGKLDSLTRMELQDVLLSLLMENNKTAMMVTHDVDEALYCSDRIVMMTCGPAARIGEIVEVPFERPRERVAVLSDPRYDQLRDRLIGFLADQEQRQVAMKRSPVKPKDLPLRDEKSGLGVVAV